MISAGDFRNGVTFEEDGNLMQIIEFQHVKPGKGAAFVRTKVRNIITGATVEKTYNPNDKFPSAFIERKDMQYLYEDSGLYYFMDNETYENIPVGSEIVEDNLKFVKENENVKIQFHKGSVFGIEPPNFVELEITQTEPGIKGDSTTNVMKPAVVETGAEIRVPLFINEGDRIRIDTRTGSYMERSITHNKEDGSMNISEKVAYLKGLAEGMELSKTSNEGKMLLAILEVLDEVADSMENFEFDLDVISAELSEMDEDLDYLFEETDDSCHGHHHDHDDEDDYEDYEGDVYEITCPNCEQTILLDEESLDEGELYCFNCKEKLEIDFSELFEEDEELNLNLD